MDNYTTAVKLLKERLLVQDLIDNFIKNNDSPPIAILAGVRRIGKTTILKQIQNKHPNSIYLEMEPNNIDQADDIMYIIHENKVELLLIDEYTNVDYYDMLAQEIYNNIQDKKMKIILTASSPYHLYKLYTNKLGGGRAILFKLPPITFIEYLYFTNKIDSYLDIDNIKNEWFVNYLNQENLNDGLKVNLDSNYFTAWDIDNSNYEKQGYYGGSRNRISIKDVESLFDLVAYKFSQVVEYETLTEPKLGMQEHRHIPKVKRIYKLSEVNLCDLILNDSVIAISKLKVNDIAKILAFLIRSGMAIISNDDTSTHVEDLVNLLDNGTNSVDNLKTIFKNKSIQLVSPLYYTRIGRDIFSRFGVDLNILEKGDLTGKLVEVYLSGALYFKTKHIYYDQYKLNSDGEVDIFDDRKLLLLESTISDKKIDDIAIYKYYRDVLCIRVCSSKTKNYFNKNGNYHVIPYGKLMCMIDTGEIFNLERTTTN